MAGYQFDELTKELAGAKSRRGFLKGLLGAGLAAAATGTVMPLVASAAPCPTKQKCKSLCCPPGYDCCPGFPRCVPHGHDCP
jgi:hypothetical protein